MTELCPVSCAPLNGDRALVEEQGDVVGGELLVRLSAGAGSNCGGFVFGLVEILKHGIGEMADVGAVPLDDESGGAGLALRHGAGFAGVLVGWRGRETLCLKQLLHLTLDGLCGEGWDFASEVLHGEEQALVLAYSDAYDIQFGIEEVG